jgi:hypothetical protein
VFVFGLLVFVAIGVLAWKFVAPGQRFLPEFSRLLTDPKMHSHAFAFLSGRSKVTGQSLGRDASVEIQLPRSKYGTSYLVVKVRASGVESLTGTQVDSRATDDAARRALYLLAMQDLQLSLEDGWLRALWSPKGLFIFPGGFSEEKWRKVLEAMHTVASSLEGRPNPS